MLFEIAGIHRATKQETKLRVQAADARAAGWAAAERGIDVLSITAVCAAPSGVGSAPSQSSQASSPVSPLSPRVRRIARIGTLAGGLFTLAALGFAISTQMQYSDVGEKADRYEHLLHANSDPFDKPILRRRTRVPRNTPTYASWLLPCRTRSGCVLRSICCGAPWSSACW